LLFLKNFFFAFYLNPVPWYNQTDEAKNMSLKKTRAKI